MLLASFSFIKDSVQLAIPDWSKYTEGVAGISNYDVTVSNGVNLCDPHPLKA